MIVIVDYGMGNSASIINMIGRIALSPSIKAIVSSNPADIAKARALILPGVGAFDHAMQRLREQGLANAIVHRVRDDKIPFLGICLGMHLLFQSSEEGNEPGLALLPGRVVRFAGEAFSSGRLKIPHMGWNEITVLGQQQMLAGLEKNSRFYFVHSYHVVCAEAHHVAAICKYDQPFTCTVSCENIFAVQFHPEKSHRFGMTLFKNFIGQLC